MTPPVSGHAEGAVERHIEHRGPLLVGHVHKIGGTAEASVVDDDMHRSECFPRRREERIDFGLHGHVAKHGGRTGAGSCLEVCRGFFHPPRVDIRNEYAGALLQAPLGGGETDTRPRRRGDHDVAPGQQVVAVGIFRWVCKVSHVRCSGSCAAPLQSSSVAPPNFAVSPLSTKASRAFWESVCMYISSVSPCSER